MDSDFQFQNKLSKSALHPKILSMNGVPGPLRIDNILTAAGTRRLALHCLWYSNPASGYLKKKLPN